MQPHGAFEILAIHVLKRPDFDDADTVDQDVDLAEAIDDVTNSGINLCGIEQVALNGQDRATWSEISLSTGQFVRITCDEGNVTPLPTNVSRKHKTESARTACDQCDFASQGIASGSNQTDD